MQWLIVQPGGAVAHDSAPDNLPADGFVWLDILLDQLQGRVATDLLRTTIEQSTGIRVFDLHLQDATNPQHPSYFDATSDYSMLVFRKLVTGETPPLEAAVAGADEPHALQQITTRPVTFFLFGRALVTVRSGPSRTIDQIRHRLLDQRAREADPASNGALRSARPADLMLRLLNAMVDRYLELREPLSQRLDRWQQALIDPRRPFWDWAALLEARIELRRLENLCEGQHDALLEMRDAYLDETPQAQQSDAYLVRLNDVIEHVDRVLSHARRLESTAESAVQLHFSAATHQTNQIVRTLTVITAIFLPLTLITGIFGMNFDRMPLLEHPNGFWWTISAMVALASVLLLFFWTRRLLARPRGPRWLRWRRARR
jgi:magnesium transporter